MMWRKRFIDQVKSVAEQEGKIAKRRRTESTLDTDLSDASEASIITSNMETDSISPLQSPLSSSPRSNSWPFLSSVHPRYPPPLWLSSSTPPSPQYGYLSDSIISREWSTFTRVGQEQHDADFDSEYCTQLVRGTPEYDTFIREVREELEVVNKSSRSHENQAISCPLCLSPSSVRQPARIIYCSNCDLRIDAYEAGAVDLPYLEKMLKRAREDHSAACKYGPIVRLSDVPGTENPLLAMSCEVCQFFDIIL